jgi:hypothetical protein
MGERLGALIQLEQIGTPPPRAANANKGLRPSRGASGPQYRFACVAGFAAIPGSCLVATVASCRCTGLAAAFGGESHMR